MPEDIQVAILGFLPLRDAVRTSILSRNWRYSWTMIRHLIFDEKFFESIKEKLDQCHNPEWKALKFVSVINNVLLLHNSPILIFSLEILNGFEIIEQSMITLLSGFRCSPERVSSNLL